MRISPSTPTQDVCRYRDRWRERYVCVCEWPPPGFLFPPVGVLGARVCFRMRETSSVLRKAFSEENFLSFAFEIQMPPEISVGFSTYAVFVPDSDRRREREKKVKLNSCMYVKKSILRSKISTHNIWNVLFAKRDFISRNEVQVQIESQKALHDAVNSAYCGQQCGYKRTTVDYTSIFLRGYFWLYL